MLSSPYQIRFAAGLLFSELQVELFNEERTEPQSGDGSTTIFYTEHVPLVDKNDGDEAAVDDVTVYVNGSEVTVSAIDAAAGKITLAAAPANEATLTIDYVWSSVDDDKITEYGDEAATVINANISSIYVYRVDDAAVNADFDNSMAQTYLMGLEKRLAAGRLLQVMYTEENDSLHKQGVEMELAVMKQLKAIQGGLVKLYDANGTELARMGTQSPNGYPIDADDPSDESSKFSISMEL